MSAMSTDQNGSNFWCSNLTFLNYAAYGLLWLWHKMTWLDDHVFTTNTASKHPISSWNYQFVFIGSNGLAQWSPAWQPLHQNVTYWPFHAKMRKSIYIHGIWKRYDTYYRNHGLQKTLYCCYWTMGTHRTPVNPSVTTCLLDEYMSHVCVVLDLLGQKERWILRLLAEHHPSVQKQFLQTELCPGLSLTFVFSFPYSFTLTVITPDWKVSDNIFQQKVWKKAC